MPRRDGRARAGDSWGPLGPPAPRGPHVEPRGARAGHNRALRGAQAVLGGEAHRTKMGAVHAGHAPEGRIDPTDSWGALGAHVVAARGTCRARVARSLSVRSLVLVDLRGLRGVPTDGGRFYSGYFSVSIFCYSGRGENS